MKAAACIFGVLAIIQGETVIGNLHRPAHHYFCESCLIWLFTKPAGIDEYLGVRSNPPETQRIIYCS